MSFIEQLLKDYPNGSEALLTIMAIDPELVDIINSKKELTLILPTNSGLLKSYNQCSRECLENESFANLKKIFRYHVIPTLVSSRGGYKSLAGDVVLFNPLGYINDKWPIEKVLNYEGKRVIIIDHAMWPKSVLMCCRENRIYLYSQVGSYLSL